MTQTVRYTYSLNFCLGTILLMVVLMYLLFSNAGGPIGIVALAIYGFFSLVFLSTLALLVVKRLIPALKGDIALELDEEGINDYIRNISINWNDINEISLIRGRSASIMQVDLKWESDYGKQLNIPLRWIKGKDDEIYETVMACFEQGVSNSAEEN
jgi:hypothetical protein